MTARGGRQQARIEDVARAAGVSRSTVSRVVNGGVLVSPNALAAVRLAISELGYVPNRAAQSLASRHAHAIALVVPEDTHRFFGDPFFGDLVSGIGSRLNRSDYVMTLFIASEETGEKIASYIQSGAVDAAIVVSTHTSDTFIDGLARTVPIVYGGRPARRHSPGNEYYVDVDNVRAGILATEYLIDAGYSRIACIAGSASMPAGIDRLEGYKRALSSRGYSFSLIEEGHFTEDGGAAAMGRLLLRGEAFDALFVASDLMARGALSVIERAGLRVPRDLAIIGFDDSPIATAVSPQLTTIRQPTFAEGQMMADVVLSLLSGGQPQQVTLMDVELIRRASA